MLERTKMMGEEVGEQTPLLNNVNKKPLESVSDSGYFEDVPADVIKYIASFLNKFSDLNSFVHVNQKMLAIFQNYQTSVEVPIKNKKPVVIQGTYTDLSNRLKEIVASSQKIKSAKNSVSYKIADSLDRSPPEAQAGIGECLFTLGLVGGAIGGGLLSYKIKDSIVSVFSGVVGGGVVGTALGCAPFIFFKAVKYLRDKEVERENKVLESIVIKK